MPLDDVSPSSGGAGAGGHRHHAAESAAQAVPASSPAHDPFLQLTDRARRGDRSSLEQLFVSLQPEIRRTVEQVIRRNRHRRIAATDVCQLVAVQVLLHLDQLAVQDRATFHRWLRGIALHCLQTCWRERVAVKRGAGRELLWSELDDAQRGEWNSAGVAQTASVPDRAHLDESRRRLSACLKQLVERDRRLVRWVFIEGMSCRSVAKRLKQDEATVRRRLAHALGVLATALCRQARR